MSGKPHRHAGTARFTPEQGNRLPVGSKMRTDRSTRRPASNSLFFRVPLRLDGTTPCPDGSALRKIKGDLGFRTLAMLSGHCTKLHSVALILKNPQLSPLAILSPAAASPRTRNWQPATRNSSVIVGARPYFDGSALRKVKGELGFRAFARCFSHGTKWYSVVRNSNNFRLAPLAVLRACQ